jgi:periplasmic protein TonB
MKKKMFEGLVEKPRVTKKWLFFPLSLLVHGFVIAAVVIFPLMSEGNNLPEVKVVNIMLTTAAPPPPPPPPPAPKKGKKRPKKANQNKPEEAPKPVPTDRFVAPVKIPNEILEEDIDDWGTDGGSEFGVIGGVPDGVPGGVIGSTLLGKDEHGSFTQELRISRVSIPKLMRRIEPQYPTVALKAHIEGRVLLEAITDISGRVKTVRIVTGHPLLRAAAVQAVKQWIYEPYMINGNPRPVVFTVNINFSLKNR